MKKKKIIIAIISSIIIFITVFLLVKMNRRVSLRADLADYGISLSGIKYEIVNYFEEVSFTDSYRVYSLKVLSDTNNTRFDLSTLNAVTDNTVSDWLRILYNDMKDSGKGDEYRIDYHRIYKSRLFINKYNKYQYMYLLYDCDYNIYNFLIVIE